MIKGVAGMEAVRFRERMVKRPQVECETCGTVERLAPTRRGKIVRHTCEHCGHTTTLVIE